MELCIIGSRGHQSYVLDGLKDVPFVKITGISTGTEDDCVVEMKHIFGDRAQDAEVFSDYYSMLDTLKPDVVSIAGPLEKHSQMCIDAFELGIHVFCEKPVATNLKELEKLKNAFAGTDVHFASMMGMRYDPAFYTAWCSVMDGIIGEVRLINAQKSYKLGHRPNNYSKHETYGGTIPWVGSHAIDWVHWFSCESFQTVYAAHSSKHNCGLGELEMTALCLFSLTNDIFASVSMDYFRPDSASTHGDDRIRIVGTRGIIEVNKGKVFLINNNANGRTGLKVVFDRQIFSDFIEHINGNSVSLIDAEDTFIVTEACLLARQSADEERVIAF
jgi:predicted dehydrogenase